jgi:hypothetical protein
MPATLNPGVPNVYRRIRRQDEERTLRLVRTDIAGFLGYAERGPLADPNVAGSGVLRLTSWAEFVAHYGGFIRTGTLAYAVRAFFENGGRVCHVARIAALGQVPESERPSVAECPIPAGFLGSSGQASDLAVTLHAKSAGAWGNYLTATATLLSTPGTEFPEFALRVVNDRGVAQMGPIEEEFYHRLSLDEGSDYFAREQLDAFSNLIRIEISPAAQEWRRPGTSSDSPPMMERMRFEGGRDGLSSVTPLDFIGGSDDLRGLRLFEEIDEVSILCAPDAVHLPPPPGEPPPEPPADPCAAPPDSACENASAEDPTSEPPALEFSAMRDIQVAMTDQCERLRDRVAILDFPEQYRTAPDLLAWRRQFGSPFGAIYFPWLKVPDALALSGPVRAVPPCGHVAGVYAQLDRQVGVHRPPANVALEFATDVGVEVDDEFQQDLNPEGINAIRTLAGRGIRIWGARSVARRDQSQWRFIHVRRFMSMLEESIEKSMKWAVFETNDHTLRTTLRHMIEGFLERVWRRGGLKGEQREQAYYVKCDETNNPRQITDVGQLLCEIGVAVAAPMEFIIFELRLAPGGSEFESRERRF